MKYMHESEIVCFIIRNHLGGEISSRVLAELLKHWKRSDSDTSKYFQINLFK